MGRIAEAARRSGRRPEQVALVVVSKTASLEQIRQLVSMGHRDFGENRVQQLVQRVAQVEEFLSRKGEPGDGGHSVRWHMIGHLQRNKVRKAVELARLIHGVDSLRVAEEIEASAMRQNEPTEVLVEVNVSGEEAKHGLAPAAIRHFIAQLDTMEGIRPRGLMCMAPLGADRATLTSVFSRCRELLDDVRRGGAGGDRFDILSMGMSQDFEVAVECGANIVRVGSAVFGSPAIAEEAAQ